MAPGTYAVEEANSEIKGYDLRDGSVTSGEAAVQAAKSAEVVLTDNYDAKTTGSLVITKTVGGDVTAEELAKGAITFTVARLAADGETVEGWLDKDGKFVANEGGAKAPVLTLGEHETWVKVGGWLKWPKCL